MSTDQSPTSASARRALAARAIALIDLTDLADDHAADGIDTLCDRAADHSTAAVCVWPEFVARCADRLRGASPRVATVVNFPSGDEPIDNVRTMTEQALLDGADDIDVVLPYRRFRDGDSAGAAEVIDAVTALVEPPRICKVILETGELTEPGEVARAAQLAVEHGADFVKTSTGKTAVGATPEAARAMLEVISAATAAGRLVGLKPSGGVRTLDDAAVYLDLADRVMGNSWATPHTFRFGASGLLDALAAELAGESSSTAEDPDGY